MRNLEMKMPGRKKTGEDEQHIIIMKAEKEKRRRGENEEKTNRYIT